MLIHASAVMFETEKSWDDVYSRFHRARPRRLSVWNETPTPFFTRLIPFLQHREVKVVVDAGCGDGKNIGPLLEAGFRVIGVDLSHAALRYCRRRFKNKKNLTLVHGSLEALPLKANSVDAIICDHVIVHVQDTAAVFGHFYRILKPGGYAMVGFTSPRDSTFGKGERLSPNEFSHDGFYLRYDTPETIEKMLRRFSILCFTSESHVDPPHGPGYVRRAKHQHHSYFVLARKESRV